MVAFDDSRNGLNLRLGDRAEGGCGKAVTDPEDRARGLEGGKPMPMGVQRPQVLDLGLKAGTGDNVAGGGSVTQGNQK